LAQEAGFELLIAAIQLTFFRHRFDDAHLIPRPAMCR
jgi:hypothetical protein